VRRAAVAEAAGPIVVVGDPIADSEMGIVEGIGFQSIALGLLEDSLVAAADNLWGVVDSLEEVAGPDSPVGLDSLGLDSLVDDGHQEAAR
jgi:hypothetical protein